MIERADLIVRAQRPQFLSFLAASAIAFFPQ
jgi:hypothetical protein